MQAQGWFGTNAWDHCDETAHSESVDWPTSGGALKIWGLPLSAGPHRPGSPGKGAAGRGREWQGESVTSEWWVGQRLPGGRSDREKTSIHRSTHPDFRRQRRIHSSRS